MYSFTATTTGFYTVETFGSTDTFGIVTVGSDYYIDNDSGSNTNFAIGFNQPANTTATISVTHNNITSGSGMFTIQVRKQKARIYAGDYGDINTISHSVSPELYLTSIGYEVCVHENESPHHATSFDSNFRRLNSEIFFFSGHGAAGKVQFPTPYDNDDILKAKTIKNLNMDNTKVALWASCNSAVRTNISKPSEPPENKSMIEICVESGAKSAVGFEVPISYGSVGYWSNRFFYALANGCNVNSAIQFADASILWFDPCRSHSVVGDDSTTINNANVNPKSSNNNTSQQELYKQFEYDKSEFSYTLYEDYNMKQYFKTINGIITNDFYAIMGDGTIIKSVETVSQQDIDNVLDNIEKINFDLNPQVKNGITEGKITFDRLISSKEHIIFYKKNGVVTPIKIVYSNYENDNGYSTCHVDCVNLLDNSNINYETLTFDYDFPEFE